MRLISKILLVIFVTYFQTPAYSCSTFLLNGCEDKFMAKSYDWDQLHANVLINPRNLAKQSLVITPGDQPAQWISQYGSLTFNQHGRELPLGGINEAGLAIEIMWLDTSVYPAQDNRPVVNEAQWIQYQLDNFARVADVVAHADSLRVNPIVAQVHYLVCDKTGDCSTFEYIEGKLVIHHPLKINALTNSTYDDSISFLRKHDGFGGLLPEPKGSSSLERFVRASNHSLDYGTCTFTPESVAYAFQGLTRVASPTSIFNIVYEVGGGRAHFRTRLASQIKTVDLSEFDLSCKNPDNLRSLDMNTVTGGEVSAQFKPFTLKDNLALVQLGFEKFKDQVPAALVPKLAAYPWQFRCTE